MFNCHMCDPDDAYKLQNPSIQRTLFLVSPLFKVGCQSHWCATRELQCLQQRSAENHSGMGA